MTKLGSKTLVVIVWIETFPQLVSENKDPYKDKETGTCRSNLSRGAGKCSVTGAHWSDRVKPRSTEEKMQQLLLNSTLLSAQKFLGLLTSGPDSVGGEEC